MGCGFVWFSTRRLCDAWWSPLGVDWLPLLAHAIWCPLTTLSYVLLADVFTPCLGTDVLFLTNSISWTNAFRLFCNFSYSSAMICFVIRLSLSWRIFKWPYYRRQVNYVVLGGVEGHLSICRLYRPYRPLLMNRIFSNSLLSLLAFRPRSISCFSQSLCSLSAWAMRWLYTRLIFHKWTNEGNIKQIYCVGLRYFKTSWPFPKKIFGLLSIKAPLNFFMCDDVLDR